MKIRFSPARMDEPLSGHVDGDILTLAGVAIDLSPLNEGSTLPHGAISSPYIVGDVERRDGVIYLTLICPHGANAPYETRFPSGDYINVEGEIPFPVYDVSPEEESTPIGDVLEVS
ncbi:hypothetical protein ACV1EH_00740 [Aeromonas caviae]